MGSSELDMTEVQEFAVDLTRTAARIAIKVPPVIAKGALNIKNQMRREMGASKWFKGVTPAISYDITDSGFTAEIGPERGSPGSLANIAYFGSSRGGGTVPDPIGALEAEAPNVERFLGELGVDL